MKNLQYYPGNGFDNQDPHCSKLTTSLVKETLNFKRIIRKNTIIFAEKCEELLQCKSSLQFFSKNIVAINFMSTGRDNRSSTNDLIKLTML